MKQLFPFVALWAAGPILFCIIDAQLFGLTSWYFIPPCVIWGALWDAGLVSYQRRFLS